MQQDDPAVIDCSRCLYQLFSGVGRLGIIGVDSPHHFEQPGVLDGFTYVRVRCTKGRAIELR